MADGSAHLQTVQYLKKIVFRSKYLFVRKNKNAFLRNKYAYKIQSYARHIK